MAGDELTARDDTERDRITDPVLTSCHFFLE